MIKALKMEKHHRNNKATKASKLIDKVIPQRPRKPSTYDMLKQSNPEHRLVTEYDAAMKIFDEYWESVRLENLSAIKTEPVEVKKLVEVDIKSAYSLFKIKYFEVTGREFDFDANEGESKMLAYTLLYYFFRDERFLKSPLINTEINDPGMMKGVLVIGDYGCGKTSIFKAIRKMFFDAERDDTVMIGDVDGDDVSLKRYRRLFGYYTANEVVQMFEACTCNEEKERFWQIFNKGEIYFDDLMTERQASNYGKVELFKDILEIRDDKSLRTLGSTNYEGNTNETLMALGKKYGPRVYDRLFKMFNIIELKGGSLRK
jgi:DNA replication protein DnaC